MADRRLDNTRGILDPKRILAGAKYARHLPATDLEPFVDWYWSVEWALESPKTVETIPHPSVFLICEPGRAQLAGVSSAKFSRELVGTSRVFGVKFRAGGFRAFVDVPISTYSNKVFPLSDVFGSIAEHFDRRVLAHTEHRACIEVVESFVRSRRPVATDVGNLAATIVERIESDRRITKVEHVTELFSMGLRKLQRLFDDYVGIGPKWIIQRYRLHEAAERIAKTQSPNLTELAIELGYADQAHFTRDFKRLIGRSPSDYAKLVAHPRST
jgi:AraC-like DNA-binding protein